jgi:hypothetical protein
MEVVLIDFNENSYVGEWIRSFRADGRSCLKGHLSKFKIPIQEV